MHVINSGNKAHISVLACSSASGYAIPPMVIFQRKTLTPQLTLNEVPGTIYGLSASGWVDRELFKSGSIVTFCSMCHPPGLFFYS